SDAKRLIVEKLEAIGAAFVDVGCESAPKWDPTAESHQPFDISVGTSFALGSRSAPIGVQSGPHQNA
ncbi:hypothetical protein, partial [Acidiphilium sp.]|uniref:hypothetical protein n=1 Tax=Acidiphilium sp. TaxID=527 RepID=UPI00258AE0E9